MFLARSPKDFHVALGILTKWTQGIDYRNLDVGFMVTARFPRLLPKFRPHLHIYVNYEGFYDGKKHKK